MNEYERLDNPNFLFRLRVPVSASAERGRSIVLINAYDSRVLVGSHNRIDIEVLIDGKIIFPSTDKESKLWCKLPCPYRTNGKHAKELVLATVSRYPGDAKADEFDSYFYGYTKDQLAFAKTYGEELDMIREHPLL